MKPQQLAAAVVLFVQDDGAYKRASSRDLAIIEGVLASIIWRMQLELERRDKAGI